MNLKFLKVQTNTGETYLRKNHDILKTELKSTNRLRLNKDRVFLNQEIKPLANILFCFKNLFFKMICCPARTFIMGHYENRYDNPPRTEDINKPFLLGEAEVTQELYQAVMGYNPSKFKDDSKKPVEQVTWFDAVYFCNRLSKIFEMKPYYQISNIKYDPNHKQHIESADVTINSNSNGFRLPTEKEWEYAAKAGTNNRWSGFDNDNEYEDFSWLMRNSMYQTHHTGTKVENEWGFYDMSGNVWEWCFDSHEIDRRHRIYRGGSYHSISTESTISNRRNNEPHKRNSDVGFRIASSLFN